jgi:hypothetical protein
MNRRNHLFERVIRTFALLTTLTLMATRQTAIAVLIHGWLGAVAIQSLAPTTKKRIPSRRTVAVQPRRDLAPNPPKSAK